MKLPLKYEKTDFITSNVIRNTKHDLNARSFKIQLGILNQVQLISMFAFMQSVLMMLLAGFMNV